MIWEYLSNAFLQESIGENVFDQLEEILPILEPDSNPGDIYKKDNLINLFNAFLQPKKFQTRDFRSKVLGYIPEDEIDRLCDLLEINVNNKSFNEKVDLIVKRGWNNPDVSHAFITWGDLSNSFYPQQRESWSEREIIPTTVKPYKVLKDFQLNVYLRASELIKINNSRFVIQMPTGSGKTRTIMELVTEYLNDSTENITIVWLAHSEELCQQALECFKEVWVHVAKKEIEIYKSWGKTRGFNLSVEKSVFMVSSFQKLFSLLKKDNKIFSDLRTTVKLIVVDEAHKVMAPTYKYVTEALLGLNSRLVGLTATPGRSVIDHYANKKLSEFFFNKIVAIPTKNDESPISMLKREKVLSRIQYEPLITNQNYKLSKRDLNYLEKWFEFSPGFLKHIGNDLIRNAEILKKLYYECQEGKRCLFFGCSVAHSKFICSMLIFKGISAGHIDGDTDKRLREKYIEDFRSGKLQVICNYGILSTGFDAPKTDLVFISRPTASLVLYSQMIGRGLRGPAIGGTANCKIIDVKDNIDGYQDAGFVYDYFSEYWEED